MPFTSPILKKFTTAQWHWVDICYTEFHPNRSKFFKITSRNYFVQLSLHRLPWNLGLASDFLWIPSYRFSWKSDERFSR